MIEANKKDKNLTKGNKFHVSRKTSYIMLFLKEIGI
jgi:hypothetical protein